MSSVVVSYSTLSQYTITEKAGKFLSFYVVVGELVNEKSSINVFSWMFEIRCLAAKLLCKKNVLN